MRWNDCSRIAAADDERTAERIDLVRFSAGSATSLNGALGVPFNDRLQCLEIRHRGAHGGP
jgi:hypothetical protein